MIAALVSRQATKLRIPGRNKEPTQLMIERALSIKFTLAELLVGDTSICMYLDTLKKSAIAPRDIVVWNWVKARK